MEKIAYGYCGMPCALCPYYHIKGISRCKGCSHAGFFTGSCKIHHCCKKQNIIHCAVCTDYPCKTCASLKEFSCLDTKEVWTTTVSRIQTIGFEQWFCEYERKAQLLAFALTHYNYGRMKRYLCELFIQNDLNKLELIMEKAENLTGNQKEISKQFKELVVRVLSLEDK